MPLMIRKIRCLSLAIIIFWGKTGVTSGDAQDLLLVLSSGVLLVAFETLWDFGDLTQVNRVNSRSLSCFIISLAPSEI